MDCDENVEYFCDRNRIGDPLWKEHQRILVKNPWLHFCDQEMQDPIFASLPCRVAATVEPFRSAYDDQPAFIKYAMCAADDAIADADLLQRSIDKTRIAVSIGTGLSGIGEIAMAQETLKERDTEEYPRISSRELVATWQQDNWPSNTASWDPITRSQLHARQDSIRWGTQCSC